MVDASVKECDCSGLPGGAGAIAAPFGRPDCIVDGTAPASPRVAGSAGPVTERFLRMCRSTDHEPRDRCAGRSGMAAAVGCASIDFLTGACSVCGCMLGWVDYVTVRKKAGPLVLLLATLLTRRGAPRRGGVWPRAHAFSVCLSHTVPPPRVVHTSCTTRGLSNGTAGSEHESARRRSVQR